MSKEVIKGYKAFEKDLTCRGYQYEIGKEYEQEGNIQCCNNGFHFCKNPFDVLDYYPLIDNEGNITRFAIVEGSGSIDKEKNKVAVSNIKIIEELTLGDFINNGIEFIQEETQVEVDVEDNKDSLNNSGNYAKIGSSGYNAQIGSSGYNAQIGSSGYNAQIGSSGNYAQIGSSGYNAQIGSSGYYAKIGSSGNYAQIGSSGYNAQIGSSGYNAKIGSSGNYAKINSTGEYSVIMCAGNNSIAKAKKGSWITLSEWIYDNDLQKYIPICVKTEQVDGEKIKEDTWYKLEDGEFVEVKND